MMHLLLAVMAVLLLAALAAAAPAPEVFNPREFGAVGDGKADDTRAFQAALDAAGKAGGGTVLAGRGNYRFAGHLTVPNGVALAGIWQSAPAHNGLRDRRLCSPAGPATTSTRQRAGRRRCRGQ